ncbi:hypothetical protein A2635_02005 [Candidatus Peribacteria bacterium RIFCSPHIGHO2_01_FULL_51_9]|nr:MAG: hypothetical protein A2635_02005 [Candidatus Peribacteria bacterium RIFCSPHIGHO2_01_FULL_51_9]
MEGDTYHTPAKDQEDLHSRIIQRNLNGITTPDPELEEELLQYCQNPGTSDDMILLTVDQYDNTLGNWLSLWVHKPASFILEQAIQHEKQGKIPAANILYQMAYMKGMSQEAMFSEERTNSLLWTEYTLNANQPEAYEAHDSFKKKLCTLCHCIKHDRIREIQGHY